MIQERAD